MTEPLSPEALDTIEARANQDTTVMQADLDAGKVSIFANYLVVEVEQCTCAGGTSESNYMHESGCGLEPIARVADLVWGAARTEAKALVVELRRLRTENEEQQRDNLQIASEVIRDRNDHKALIRAALATHVDNKGEGQDFCRCPICAVLTGKTS